MIQWTLFYSFLCISRSYFILILTWVRQFNKLQSDNEGILQWLSCWAMKLCREGQILAIQFLPFWSLLHKTQVRKFKCLKSIDCLFSENTKIEILVKIHRRTFHLLTRHFFTYAELVFVEGLLSSLFNFFVELTVNMILLSSLFNMFQSTGHLPTSLITSCPQLAYMWKLCSRGE